jgi:hypothetical protein
VADRVGSWFQARFANRGPSMNRFRSRGRESRHLPPRKAPTTIQPSISAGIRCPAGDPGRRCTRCSAQFQTDARFGQSRDLSAVFSASRIRSTWVPCPISLDPPARSPASTELRHPDGMRQTTQPALRFSQSSGSMGTPMCFAMNSARTRRAVTKWRHGGGWAKASRRPTVRGPAAFGIPANAGGDPRERRTEPRHVLSPSAVAR